MYSVTVSFTLFLLSLFLFDLFSICFPHHPLSIFISLLSVLAVTYVFIITGLLYYLRVRQLYINIWIWCLFYYVNLRI